MKTNFPRGKTFFHFFIFLFLFLFLIFSFFETFLEIFSPIFLGSELVADGVFIKRKIWEILP